MTARMVHPPAREAPDRASPSSMLAIAVRCEQGHRSRRPRSKWLCERDEDLRTCHTSWQRPDGHAARVPASATRSELAESGQGCWLVGAQCDFAAREHAQRHLELTFGHALLNSGEGHVDPRHPV